MKRKILSITKLLLFMIAVMAAVTPSQIGGYQPKCPDQLKKFKS